MEMALHLDMVGNSQGQSERFWATLFRQCAPIRTSLLPQTKQVLMKVVIDWRLLYSSAKYRNRKIQPIRNFIKLRHPIARRENGLLPMEETVEEGVHTDLSSSSSSSVDESSGSDVPLVHLQEEADGEVPHRLEVFEEDLLADFLNVSWQVENGKLKKNSTQMRFSEDSNVYRCLAGIWIFRGGP